jgi:hypothetical protein
MSSLSIDDQRRLLDACAEMAQDRAQIAAVLAELPTSWRNVRAALNELQRFVERRPPRPGTPTRSAANTRM